MSIVLNGTDGISDVDGSASTPAIRGTDANTGIFFPAADTASIATGGSERVRVDSSGNVGIGTTTLSGYGTNGAKIYQKATGTNINQIISQCSADDSAITLGHNGTVALINSTYGVTGSVKPLALYVGDSERMRIDTSGNVGIGTTSPAYKLDINEASTYSTIGLRQGGTLYGFIEGGSSQVKIGANAAIPMLFEVNGTERSRITSGGNFLVGTTSYDYRLSVMNTATNARVGYFRADSSSYTDSVLILDTPTSAGTSCRLIEGYSGSSTLCFRVYNNGNVQNTNNSYGSISDLKLKENITDATPKLASLNQLRVVNYNLKGNTLKQIGLVAQEVEQVFPGLVDESPDRDAEGNDLGTTTKSVKYSVFVPMLIKAMQELKSELDTVKAQNAAFEARLAALEAN